MFISPFSLSQCTNTGYEKKSLFFNWYFLRNITLWHMYILTVFLFYIIINNYPRLSSKPNHVWCSQQLHAFQYYWVNFEEKKPCKQMKSFLSTYHLVFSNTHFLSWLEKIMHSQSLSLSSPCIGTEVNFRPRVKHLHTDSGQRRGENKHSLVPL